MLGRTGASKDVIGLPRSSGTTIHAPTIKACKYKGDTCAVMETEIAKDFRYEYLPRLDFNPKSESQLGTRTEKGM